MPRHYKYDDDLPRAPLSFFDEDETSTQGPAVGFTPAPRARKATAAKKVAPAPPGVVHTTTFSKKRKTKNPSSVPGPMVEGSKRFVRFHIKQHKDLMKTHFKETHEIYDQHASWPGYATFKQIGKYIQDVKTDYLKLIWANKTMNHKAKLMEIHSTEIEETDDFNFEQIHDEVSSFAKENSLENRLTLNTPWATASHTPFVTVVLAWLFAAKKQLMYTLTVYLKAHKAADSAAAKFIRESEAGAEARKQFKNWKTKLPKREPRTVPFPDHDVLEEQYKALHPHHTLVIHRA